MLQILVCGLLIGWLLAGCSANWRAPVETRGQSSASTKPVPRVVSSATEYRVQRGDTLHGIAWQHGTDYRSIARWNGLRPPYRIYPGQTLRLVAPAQVRTPPPPTPPKARNRVETKPAPAKPEVQRGLSWTWPANGEVVSTFKSGEPLRSGIRIAGRDGDRIVAAEAGRVVYSGSGLIGYGRLIIVKHNDNYLSAYGHNRKILVEEGDQVTKGQKIAEMGSATNGDPLLHFEIRRDGKPVDPLPRLPRR